tara:strand:- start:2313 stop:4109 length:1797 start_codon:yes stop_codon:yes gene_type:complete
MGFKDKKRRKQIVKTEGSDHSNVVVIKNSEEHKLELNFNGEIARFERLRYLGCPTYFASRDKSSVVLLNRDAFVNEMFELFKGYDTTSKTGYGRFCFLCNFVKYWDGRGEVVDFSLEQVIAYFNHRNDMVLLGKKNKNSLVKEKQHLVSILNELGKEYIAQQIPKIENRRGAAIPTKAIADKDYGTLGLKLMAAFHEYVRCFFNGVPPITCPLFDIDFAVKNGITEAQIRKSRGARYVEKNVYWTNSLTRIAIIITAKWTGANLAPLTSLTKGDAKLIKKSTGDNYKFDSVKARALYQRQGLGIGFTKRAKEFIESWLVVSEKMAPGDDAPLFPIFDAHGSLKVTSSTYNNPHKSINHKLKAMGLPEITLRKLRNTRSSLIQRAFEDTFITASANRNTIQTTHEHYLNGVEQNHEMELARAFEVQKALTEGKEKKAAIEEFKAKIKDPFTSEEWKAKRKEATANKLPNGARCTEPTGKVAKKSLRAIKSLNLGDDRECISFLACFDCSKHALVAEVDDIWLMLSFLDSLMETISRPSINSYPSEAFQNAVDKTQHILSRMQVKSPDNYELASCKHSEAPHPLYSEETDLTDLMEIYGI